MVDINIFPEDGKKIAKNFIDHYKLKPGDKILDIGCGKGFLLFDLLTLEPELEIFGIDISHYAIENSKPEIRDKLIECCATKLPFKSNYFDLIISINTLHNLYAYELEQSLIEIERVGKKISIFVLNLIKMNYKK